MIILYTCIHVLFILKYDINVNEIMRAIKLTKIKKEHALIIPESIIKLYDFRVGQIFNLEVKETNNPLNLVILTYATILK